MGILDLIIWVECYILGLLAYHIMLKRKQKKEAME